MKAAIKSLRIVEVKDSVLPPEWESRFEKNKVKLNLLDLTGNPAGNGKFFPAWEILKRAVEQYPDAEALDDSTSGNYGVALAYALELYRKEHPECRLTRIIMAVSKSLPSGKRKLLTDCGIELLDAKDSLDAMKVAEEHRSEEHT